MKFIVFALFILTIFIQDCISQNLVRNGSFEQFTSLQDKVDFIFYLDSYCTDCFYAKDWQIPTNIGVDYYNCDNENFKFSVPTNCFGYHPAQDGCAYIGLMPITWNGGFCEHLTGTLRNTMQEGKKYRVSFYIRHAGKASRFGFGHIGVYFHEELFPFNVYDWPTYERLIDKDHTYDVVATESNFVFNDTTWTKVEGVYKAKGNENYFTIGVFNLSEEYNVSQLIGRTLERKDSLDRERLFRRKEFRNLIPLKEAFSPVKSLPGGDPYYFIDNVSIIPIN